LTAIKGVYYLYVGNGSEDEMLSDINISIIGIGLSVEIELLR